MKRNSSESWITKKKGEKGNNITTAPFVCNFHSMIVTAKVPVHFSAAFLSTGIFEP
jgi:hypothetical protein